MSHLRRPVLLISRHKQLQILPSDTACRSCPTPCHPVGAAPINAVAGEMVLSSGLLNRMALAVFGLPLLLIGGLIICLQFLSTQSAVPLALVLGIAMACALGGRIARKTLPELNHALKASGVVPSIFKDAEQ